MAGKLVLRRHVLGAGAGGLAAFVAGCKREAVVQPAITGDPSGGIGPSEHSLDAHDGAFSPAEPFKLKFAPHFGLFRHSAGMDAVAQIEFAARQGFRAWEDNTIPQRTIRDQDRIASALKLHDMTMGVFTIGSSVGYRRPALVTGNIDDRDGFLREIESGLAVAKRMNARWVMVNPGMADNRIEVTHQYANVAEALRRAAEILEPEGIVMVLEPTHAVIGERSILNSMSAGYLVCKAVARPGLKLLFDVYQQQVMRGNIVNELDNCWDEVAYIQVADHPGRAEPLTGEINYVNVLRHIRAKGYDGLIGLEHFVYEDSPEGEATMIKTYHELNALI